MKQGLTKQKHMFVVVACQGVFDVLNSYILSVRQPVDDLVDHDKSDVQQV